MQKRGMSEVIVSMIMIILVVVAVGIIWFVVKNVFNQGTEEVSLGKVTINLEVKKVVVEQTVGVTTDAIVTVGRGAGSGEIDVIKFIFKNDSDTETFEEKVNIGEFEDRAFTFTLTKFNGSTLKTVSVVPIFMSGKKENFGTMDTFEVTKYNVRPSCEDDDSDKYTSAVCGGYDCDDSSASINPNGTEVCNSKDDDCDGVVDECLSYYYCNAGSCITTDVDFLKYQSGLVSWYRLNENANDETGTNNGAAYNGAVTTTSGKFNNAYSFTDNRSYIDLGQSPTLSFKNTTDFTIMAWIYPVGNSWTSSSGAIFSKFQALNNKREYYVDIVNSGKKIAWNSLPNSSSSTPSSLTSTSAISLSSWTFITFTGMRNPSANKHDIKIYINGILDATGQTNYTCSLSYCLGTNAYIGGIVSSTSTPDRVFNGAIDEVMVFSRALNSSEITTIYGLNLA